MNLKQNLNIIYGKNGRGKTTLLHIIANALELDFARFNHINFKLINITTSEGDVVQIKKNDDGNVVVVLNESLTSYEGGIRDLSDSERATLRKVLGERPTYLPAFRSVLERARDLYIGPYDDRRTPEYDKLLEQEMITLRERGVRDIAVARDQDQARLVAAKTVRCREWFGAFVPMIRYPSVLDVADGLSEEWRNAQLALNKKEQRQFEEAFLEIFTAIANHSVDESHEVARQDDVLSAISNLLSDQSADRMEYNENSTYDKLMNVVRGIDRVGSYNSLLGIYKNILEERKKVRQQVMRPLVDFEVSVNKFLDQKKIRIGSKRAYGSDSSFPIRLRGQFVYVEAETGKPYRLTALSSGERQIATMLYSASRSAFNNGSFLIDEPELSLHIDWQRMVLSEIQQQYPERQIVACTHSPEVGAEHIDSVQLFEPTAYGQIEADSHMHESINDDGV